MKNSVLVLFMVLVLASLLPFTEGRTEKGSMDITSLTINFNKTEAIFTVDYDIGDLPKLYVLLLGGKSLEPKINAVFSNFEYQILKMDEGKAILKVNNISRLDKGYYLHDSRSFGDSVRTIYIYSSDSKEPKKYNNLNYTPYYFYRS